MPLAFLAFLVLGRQIALCPLLLPAPVQELLDAPLELAGVEFHARAMEHLPFGQVAVDEHHLLERAELRHRALADLGDVAPALGEAVQQPRRHLDLCAAPAERRDVGHTAGCAFLALSAADRIQTM